MAATQATRAAGLLIYRKNLNLIEYLLLQASYEPFHWTPPKGHVDAGEDEWTAAVREVREEAGIDVASALEVHKDFKYEMHYTAISKKHGNANKKVTYWLAKTLDPELKITLSDEHMDWKWNEMSKAIELAKFAEMKKMLEAADTYLKFRKENDQTNPEQGSAD